MPNIADFSNPRVDLVARVLESIKRTRRSPEWEPVWLSTSSTTPGTARTLSSGRHGGAVVALAHLERLAKRAWRALFGNAAGD